ncbi:FkbM family methyltransferase [Panacibacter sp. DH6]|uniref:FkbM family methyltransferase n=1 Tax=Panacibacter microcysteis TaxID=2793269 RepID=A0A931E0Q0_9BACT|nr:FkbM family methyltransferase [Panacibacter microcysteis]MBG9375315.1 FkbM family methyltransferase [Panacibacter microcysteis]
MTDKLKAWLYKTLGLAGYLKMLQTVFITGYKSGALKLNETYKWHYFVKKIVAPTDTVIDIGANLGYFSYVFSSIINTNGNLYSVEPVKPYRELLQKLLPKKPNVTIFPFALGNMNGGPVKLGMPPFLQKLQYLRHGTVTILKDESISVNQLIFESDIRKGSEVFGGLSKIDYIKCDIEGYETVVFPELRPVLEKHKPLVQLETWGEQLPIMLAYFRDLGYKAYNLQHNKLVSCDILPAEQIASSDILFVPAERMKRVQQFLS